MRKFGISKFNTRNVGFIYRSMGGGAGRDEAGGSDPGRLVFDPADLIDLPRWRDQAGDMWFDCRRWRGEVRSPAVG